MAIDTATKRASIAAIGLMAIGPSVIPTGSFDQADRQAIGYSYSGILAGSPVVPADIDANTDQVIVFPTRYKVIKITR